MVSNRAIVISYKAHHFPDYFSREVDLTELTSLQHYLPEFDQILDSILQNREVST